MNNQLELDAKVRGLIATMCDLYSCIQPLETTKVEGFLQNVIVKILRQTCDCMMFIRAFVEDGFASTYLGLLALTKRSF